MKVIKILLWILLVLALLILLLLAAAAWMFGSQFQASQSIRKLDDGLYTMTWKGDYGFDGFLAQGGASTDMEMAQYITAFLTHGLYRPAMNDTEKTPGCSTLSASDGESGRVFGRNFDWDSCSAMVVHTIPKHGYESISTVCLDFLGFGDGWKPEGMPNQFMALAAAYLPLDGINEKGLCVADLMAGDMEPTNQNTDKPDLTTVSALRLLLDQAANVDEALELLSRYDMHSSIGSAHHLAISDLSGRSVVVEWVDNRMYVADSLAATNHYLTDNRKYGLGNQESLDRYDRLLAAYEAADGALTPDEMKALLEQVSYPNRTQWSIVYRQQARSLELYWQRKFDTPHSFSIG